MTDSEQLLRYADTRRGEDLAPLVQRHVDWVHACAQRQLHGDAHLAADVTQAVFLALAQKPPKLKDDGAVVGWLFGVTRYASYRAIRSESRRRRHESQAATMRNELTSETAEMSDSTWNQIAPLLDQLVARLPEKDRRSVILRFFQQRSYSELGLAMGISEEAARKRVSRAIEKLRQMLAAKGVAAPVAVLSAGLLAHSSSPAPAAVLSAVGGAVSGAAPAGASTAILAKGATTMMTVAYFKTVAIAALLAVLLPAAGMILLAQISSPQRPAASPAQASGANLALPKGITEGSASVVVTDEQGQPVSGAEVYVVQLVRAPDDNIDAAVITHAGPVLTDASGNAKVSQLGSLQTEMGWQQFFYVRTSGHKATLATRAFFQTSTQPPASDPVPIRVLNVAAINGLVTVPEGFESKAANVRVAFLSVASSASTRADPFFEEYLEPFRKNWPTLFNASVGDDGQFVLPDIPGTNVTLIATGLGLGAAQASVTVVREPVGMKMQPQAVIAGVLRFEKSGKSAPGMPIVLHQRDGEFANLTRRTRTDSAGQFRFTGLAEGNYTIYADIAQLPDWTMKVPPAVRVAPGQEIASLDMELESGVVVSGQVQENGTRKPMARAELVAISPANDPDSQISRAAWSDSDGKFSIRLPRGDSKIYMIRAAKGFRPPAKQGIRTISIADNGKVSGSLDFEAVPDLREQGFATVKGQLVDASGAPLAGVRIGDDRVELWDSDPMPVQEMSAATTDAEGKFSFSAKAGIVHKLFISSPEYKGPASSEFTPHADQTVTIPMVGESLPIIAWINGRVVDPQGKAIESARVEIDRESVRTYDDGKFRLPLRLGGEDAGIGIGKPSYGFRQWHDVVPSDSGSDLLFVLYPAGERPRRTGSERPLDSKLLLNLPAPALQVESWVNRSGPDNAALPLNAGRKSLIMFTSTFDNRHRFSGKITDWLNRLDQHAARLDAQPIVIFTPLTHESGIRALLKDMKLRAIVGVDQFVPYATFHSGATRITYGGENSTRVFLIRGDGVVESDDFDLDQK